MTGPGRKHLRVSCAIIERAGLILVARRGAAMSLPLKWEFPGGKIRPGETPEECLVREIKEELETDITITSSLPPATHEYPEFAVTLFPFIGTLLPGQEPKCSEHAALAWLPPAELPALDWAAADLPVLVSYCRSKGIRP